MKLRLRRPMAPGAPSTPGPDGLSAAELRRLSAAFIRWVATQPQAPDWQDVHGDARALQLRLWQSIASAGGNQARVRVSVDLFDTRARRRRPRPLVVEVGYHWDQTGTIVSPLGEAFPALIGTLAHYGGSLILTPTMLDGRPMSPTCWTVQNQIETKASS